MVTAIIPNWNGERYLGDVLSDLAAQTTPPERVIVVDNGSTDASVDIARRFGAEVIPLPSNRGFAHAVNRGITESASELVAVLNNDIRLAPDWLERLTAVLANDPSVHFATGKIYQMKDESVLDGTFDLVSRGGTAWRAGNGKSDSAVWDRSRPVAFAPMTAALFRRQLFGTIGLLDESFESYLEDVDFGLRCAVGGCSGQFVPSAIARHWGSATLGMWRPATVRRIARNQVLLVAKHYPRGWVTEYGWPVLAAQLLYGLLAARHGCLWGYARGKWEGLRRFLGVRHGSAPSSRFAGIVKASEEAIYELQQQTGFDRYWKFYFALTRRARRT
jgi:GT2 family glycosyltransferase